jgi:Ser/Thr protein kinase RdoA (MazF antagonist)
MLRTDDLRDAAERGFGVSSVADCRLLRSFINDVYRLEAGGQTWFLRVSPSAWRTVAEVEAEIAFVRAVGAGGAPVIESVPLADGSGFVLELIAPEGPRAATLFVGSPGEEPLFTNNPDALTIARRYGRVSANSGGRTGLRLVRWIWIPMSSRV